MNINEQTHVLSAKKATKDQIQEIYPGLDDATAQKYADFSLQYPPNTYIVFASNSREGNKTGFFHVLSGSLSLGINDASQDGLFIPVYEVTAAERGGQSDINGVYFPKEYPRNDFAIYSGNEGVLVVRMPYDFLDEFFTKQPKAKERFEAIQKTLFIEMLFAITKNGNFNPKKVVITAMVVMANYLNQIENISDDQARTIVTMLSRITGAVENLNSTSSVRLGDQVLGTQVLFGQTIKHHGEKKKQGK